MLAGYILVKFMEKDKKLEENIQPEQSMSNSTFSDQFPIPSAFAGTSNVYNMPPSHGGGGGGADHSHDHDMDKMEPLGFIDMLTVPDYPCPSLYEMVFQRPPPEFQSLPLSQPPLPPPIPSSDHVNNNDSNAPLESSDVATTPATPNSSSISTSSSDAQNDDQQQNKTVAEGAGQEDQDQDKTKKQ